MLRAGAVAVAVLLAAAGTARAGTAENVDPLIGTGGSGGTFPGATVPFGMVQPSPNTKSPLGGGYNYGNPVTWGFGTTHLSGPGCPAMGDVVLLPTSGTVTRTDPHAYQSRFSHASEQAQPGYYSVVLNRSGVHAELTATARTAWERFTFPRLARPGVLLAPGAGLRGAWTASVRRTGPATLAGSVGSWGYFDNCLEKTLNRYTVHFTAEFSRPFTSVSAGSGTTLQPGATAAAGPDAAAYVGFAPSPEPLVVKIGISYVSAYGAARNLAVEAPGFDFDAVRARAEQSWQSLLDRVQVSGGTRGQQTTFATALYHSLLHPNLLSDEDGRYVGFDGKVHQAGSLPQYTNFSLWDTYRSEQQLLDLVVPELVPAFATSLLRDREQGGWLPKWPYAVFATNEMVGDPAVPVLVDAYLKGLLPPDRVREAYEAMAHNATALPPPGSPFDGRPGLGSYLAFGYVPLDGGKLLFGASMTLEYALDDCALSLMARRLGDELGADILVSRAQSYRNLIGSSRFVRPRVRDGSFLADFDPAKGAGAGFAEGSSWQYTWLVPQDVPGLTAALGGPGPTLKRLDDFFAGGLYDAGNEEDLQAPYLYDYLGRPDRTQQVVSGLLRRYHPLPVGLPGNDDLGALSSWYVLGALGLYPFMAGSDTYALTAPLFPHAVVRIGGTGRPLVIERSGHGLVAGVRLDGRPWPRPWLADGTIRKGATLSYRLTPSPPSPGWGTAGADAPPAACGATVDAAHLAFYFDDRGWLTLPAGSWSTLSMNVRNDRDLPVTGAVASLELPAGWQARETRQTIGDLGPGDYRSLTWLVLPPPGASGSARVHAEVTWSTPAGSSPLMAAPARQRITVVPP